MACMLPRVALLPGASWNLAPAKSATKVSSKPQTRFPDKAFLGGGMRSARFRNGKSGLVCEGAQTTQREVGGGFGSHIYAAARRHGDT